MEDFYIDRIGPMPNKSNQEIYVLILALDVLGYDRYSIDGHAGECVCRLWRTGEHQSCFQVKANEPVMALNAAFVMAREANNRGITIEEFRENWLSDAWGAIYLDEKYRENND